MDRLGLEKMERGLGYSIQSFVCAGLERKGTGRRSLLFLNVLVGHWNIHINVSLSSYTCYYSRVITWLDGNLL